MTVSLIVLLWRNAKWAEQFIGSLSKSAKDAMCTIELVVVINGPDGAQAAEVLRRSVGSNSAGPLSVRYVDLPYNHGFAGGANAGTAVASGDLLIIANLDLRFPPSFLSVLKEVTSPGASFDLLVPSVYPLRPYQNDWYVPPKQASEKDVGPCRKSWFHNYRPVEIDSSHPVEVPAGSGCCIIVRREVVEERQRQYGAFLEARYHSFAEDTDLYWWAERKRLRVVHVPGLFVWHAGAGSFDGQSRLTDRPRHIRRQVVANWRLTVWKHMSGPKDFFGWIVGEGGYLSLLALPRPLVGSIDYVVSWRNSFSTYRAIRRDRGKLRAS